MTDKICKNCTLWVSDLDDNTTEQHKIAVKENNGFCLSKDLFTHTDSNYKCDETFIREEE